MILNKYDLETYVLPIWQGDTIYHEDVIFYEGRKSARLLYPIDEIISVRSSDLQTEYVNGKDFTVENGELKILENSRFPVLDVKPFTDIPPRHVFKTKTEGIYLSEPDCLLVRKSVVDVTYKHSRVWENGYSGKGIVSLKNEIPALFELLNSKSTVNILLYGDSMSAGWGSSGGADSGIFDVSNSGSTIVSGLNIPPYAPAWYVMMMEKIRKNYPNITFNFENISLGGKDTAWAAKNAEARLKLVKNKPDIVLIGFGGNDTAGGKTTEEYKQSTIDLINKIRTDENGNSDAVILLYSTHTCNNDAACYALSIFMHYENALGEICKETEKCALIKLSSLFADVARSKCALDRLENNINHCLDFGGRIYAQAMIESFK